MAAHTRYDTKEEERLKQERQAERTRHAAQAPRPVRKQAPRPVRKQAPSGPQGSGDPGQGSRCQGSMCHDSLYSQEFEGVDHVFGPPVE